MNKRRYFWIGVVMLAGALVWTMGTWYWMAHVLDQESIGFANTHDNADSLFNMLLEASIFRSLYSVPVAIVGILVLMIGLEPKPSELPTENEQSQFSVRLLLVITLYAASYSSLFRVSFVVAVFVAGFLPAMAMGILCSLDAFRQSRKLKLSNVLLTACTWIAAYVVSIGPVAWIARQTGIGVAMLDVIYHPVLWITNNSPLEWWLQGYVTDWRRFDFF